VFLQYFDTVGWVLWPVKNRRPYNLYCVGGDVKPCSINQSINLTRMWHLTHNSRLDLRHVRWMLMSTGQWSRELGHGLGVTHWSREELSPSKVYINN